MGLAQRSGQSCRALVTKYFNFSLFKNGISLKPILLELICLQERLRAWETREGKKAKEYEAYTFKEKKKSEEQEREGRKLKEFLEDYDDERDDPKFYKGRELQRRLAER